MSEQTENRAPFLAGIVVGGPLLAVATFGLVNEAGGRGAIAVGRWLLGANLLHDLGLAPAVCVVGWLLVRALPRVLRAPVEAAMIASGVVLVVAFPVLRGYGRDQVPGNSTVQPLDYTSATLTVLGVVWGGAAAWVLVRAVRARVDVARRTRASAPAAHHLEGEDDDADDHAGDRSRPQSVYEVVDEGVALDRTQD